MKTRLLALATLALTLAACSNDDENNNQIAARFSAEISDATLTRAAGTSWHENDEIGITATKNAAMSQYTNVKYITEKNDGNFTGSPIYFQNNQNVTFTAYYPFSGTEGNPAEKLTTKTEATNQTPTNQKNIDFLFAEAQDKNCNNANVAFEFHHKMSQITLTFIAGDGISFSDTKISYSLEGLRMSGEFDTSNGTATATGTATETLTINDVILSSTPAIVAPVILYPQNITEVNGTNQIKLSVILDGQTYSCDLEIDKEEGSGTEKLTELEAGNNYTFEITINKTGLTLDKSDIIGWNSVKGTGTAEM